MVLSTMPQNPEMGTPVADFMNGNVTRWNETTRGLVRSNPSELRLMDLENMLRMIDHLTLTRDCIHFNTQQGGRSVEQSRISSQTVSRRSDTSATATPALTTGQSTSAVPKEGVEPNSVLLWNRPDPSSWGQDKTDMWAKLNMSTLTCREDARKMIGGEGPTVSRLYRIPGVDWLVAGQEQFSSTTTLMYVDLNGLPQDNTLGPLNTRSLTDVRRRARGLTPPARKGKFLAENKPNNKHHKMYRQLAKPPGQAPGEY